MFCLILSLIFLSFFLLSSPSLSASIHLQSTCFSMTKCVCNELCDPLLFTSFLYSKNLFKYKIEKLKDLNKKGVNYIVIRYILWYKTTCQAKILIGQKNLQNYFKTEEVLQAHTVLRFFVSNFN